MKNQGSTLYGTWSSTPLGSDDSHFNIVLYSGDIGAYTDTSTNYVTCVHGVAESVQIKQNQQAAAPKGYVSRSRLTWMPITFIKNWSDANTYCNNTAINGQNGWRLPTKDEMSALYNSGAMNGQGWTLDSTWSSTPFSAGVHFNVFLGNGYVGPGGGTYGHYVTCVRFDL